MTSEHASSGVEKRNDDLRKWIRAAEQHISRERLTELVLAMTSIPSPTGEERALAEHLAQRLRDGGFDARYQAIDASQGNAVGRLAGSGEGPDVLLYAPIDTLTVGRPEEDCPWIGETLRDDMLPNGRVDGDWVIGLGASNPKGHAACILAAAEAISRTEIPLKGSVLVGFGAGGMPTTGRDQPGEVRRHIGHGAGCSHMLEQGLSADYAILAKPGWNIAWEEVGLSWFKVLVGGTFGYVGARHRLPYRNAIVEATKVISALEEWIPEYTRANTSGLVAPQAHIGNIRAGWQRMASFSPSRCEFTVELRTNPRVPPVQVQREFDGAMSAIRDRFSEVELTWGPELSIQGTSTPEFNWIIQSCIRAWEAIDGRPHEPARGTSGATDANILRSRGIPVARVGMPKVADDTGSEVDFALGMNAVDVREMERLTRLLVMATIDTAARTREETENQDASRARRGS